MTTHRPAATDEGLIPEIESALDKGFPGWRDHYAKRREHQTMSSELTEPYTAEEEATLRRLVLEPLLQAQPDAMYGIAIRRLLATLDAARAGEGLREVALRLLDAERGLGPASHAVAVANLRAALHPDTEGAPDHE